MEEPKKEIHLNLREKRMKENCKCQKEDTGSDCRCGKKTKKTEKKEESAAVEHFNSIFNRMAHLKF